MSALGELVVLLHGARYRSRTVRATIREWRHTERSRLAFERFVSHQRQGPGVSTYPLLGGPNEPECAETESLVRLWYEPPARVREERETPGRPDSFMVTVRDGEGWTTFSPSFGALRQEDTSQPLDVSLDPSVLIPALELELRPRTRHAGRSALAVSAVPRAVHSWYPTSPPLGADAHELLVDAERGVLLRVASMLDGEPFDVREVVEIGFDEELPAETFVVVPPPGEEIRLPEELHAVEHVSIEEAARRMPFTVLVPARRPEGFDLVVSSAPERERPRAPASVFLHYLPDDGTHRLSVRETAEGELEPLVAGDLQTVERDGIVYRIVEQDEGQPWRQAQVLLARDGTAVEITSDLDVGTLLELAASLVPARRDPPALV